MPDTDTDPAAPEIHLIPLDAIDPEALARDRATTDEDALAELQTSIAANGLRMPIEIFAIKNAPGRYALISGHRRLTVFRRLQALGANPEKFATIPAFIRRPESIEAAFAAMVEENEIRSELSPWERGRIAVAARDAGVFPTIDAAVETLFASASAIKRRRLRTLASLVETMDGTLTAPETLSLRQTLRIAAAVDRGYADLICHALEETTLRTPEAQWATILPILVESETTDPVEPKARNGAPGRPRRTWTAPRHSIRVWREKTPEGWRLNFTGRDAHGDLIDRVFDEIERLFSPAR